MKQSAVEATELKFDLVTLKVKDAPRVNSSSSAALTAMLPLVATQCPWGDPRKLETWRQLPLRTLAEVLRQLASEAPAAAADITGWTFDMRKLSTEDLDFIDAGVMRGAHLDGARMIAKFTAGSPLGTVSSKMVLELGYYTHYRPLLLRLQKEAREEFQAGFLNALVAVPAQSEVEPAS